MINKFEQKIYKWFGKKMMNQKEKILDEFNL